ncbi:MAG: 2'-5' RNA ligase family protein [Mycobacteriales bacterium]
MFGEEFIEPGDLAGKGREKHPHVTLKYGVDEDLEALRAALKKVGPFRVALGKTKVFEPGADSPQAAIVVLEAKSPRLKELRDAIDAAVGSRKDDHEYSPHVTLAYVDQKTAEKYAGSRAMVGKSFQVKSVTLSCKDGKRWSVELAGGKAMKAGDQYDDEIDSIIEDLLAGFDEVPGPISHELAATFLRHARETRDEFGAEDSVKLSVLNEEALVFAQRRGAELVGRRWVGDRLVANPDARWAITDTTRDKLKELLGRGFRDGIAPPDLAGMIEQSGVFSEARARLIAKTEMANAQSAGGKKTAKEVGAIAKEWELSGDHADEDDCDDNADDGVIGIDEAFSSGDDSPTAHPGCNCAVVYYTAEDSEAADFVEEDAPQSESDSEDEGATA